LALVSKDYTFSAGATIVAAEHNTNFDTLYSLVNGNLNAANLASNAGIVDTQLAQISTAGKVSTTALTGTVPSASIRRAITLTITAPTDAPTAGDGAMYFTCPTELNGMNLVAVSASTIGAGTGVTVQIARGRRSAADGALTFADMLSTAITIDTGEYDSANAATPAVINASNDDIVVSTYVDVLRIDVDVASGSGLEVRLSFQTPA
jgi:hypothetical protein